MEQQQMNISLDKTTGVSCDKCQNEVFQEVLLLRKISRFLTGQAQDGVVPVSVFACTKCSHVNNEFLPAPLRTDAVEIIEEITE